MTPTRHTLRVERFESLLQQSSSSSPQAPSTGGTSAPLAEQGSAGGAAAAEGSEKDSRRREELRRLCLEGIPDVPSHLRPRIYASLLSLPPSSSLTAQYSSFVTEISSRVSSLPPPSSSTSGPSREERYDRLLREIERDVERTFGGLAWFGAPVKAAEEGQDGEEEDELWARIALLDEAEKGKARHLAKSEAEKKNGVEGSSAENGGDESKAPSPAADTFDTAAKKTGPAEPAGAPSAETDAASSSPPKRPSFRREALLRPLFIYAFLNPGISYVQGMSYLAAILFYVFSALPPPPSASPADGDEAASSSSPPPPSPALQAEASTFFALGALLSQLRDLYTPTLDGTSSPRTFPAGHGRTSSNSLTQPIGLGATVSRFNALLMTMDPNVAEALERKGVEMGGLVIRWWTTMFANEFTLPDVVRIWDRLLSLYPPENSHQPAEALSPVLGHLIDIGLAIVLLERQKIVSPFSRLPEILTLLQSPSPDVDRLLQTAWDVRERRLGRSTHTHTKRSSVSSDLSSSSPAKGVFGFGKKLWSSASPSTPPPPSRPFAPPADPADYELTSASSSAAGSDYGRPRFGSLAFSSPRSSQDLSGNVTVVDGKVLPPPPARIDAQHETIASLIEQELQAELAAERGGARGLKSPDEADEYGIEDDDEAHAQGSSPFAKKAASGWSGFKSSLSRFAASDAAANLQKRATNLQIAAANASSTASTRLQTLQSSDAAAALFKAQSNAAAKAQLLKEQIAQDAPERLAKIREAAAGAGGRLMATGGSERGSMPGSPSELPFTPPGLARLPSPLSSPRLGASGSVDMGRQGSNGPKPLLLSSSARKAENRSDEAGSEAPSSRRSSMNWGRSPSTSPVINRTPLLSPDTSIPPLSRSPSRGAHGRSASHFDTPSRIGPSSSSSVGGTPASSFRPRASSLAQYSPAVSLQDEDSPISSSRFRDASSSALRRGGPSSRMREDGSPVPPPSSRPAQNGRGWQLSDAPIRPNEAIQLPPLDLGFDPRKVEESVEPLRKEGTGMSEAVEALGMGRMSLGGVGDEEREEPFLPPPSEPEEEPFLPPLPQEEPFRPPTDDSTPPASSPSSQLPPRLSSLANSTSSPPPPSQRTSSLASSTTDAAPSLSASTTTTHSSVDEPSPSFASAAAPVEAEDAPLSAHPSLSRSKLVRRPPAQRKRTSRSSISGVSVDLTGAEARRVASEFLTRSASGRTIGGGVGEEGVGPRRSLHRKRASEAGSRMSRAGGEFDEESFLDAYGGEEEVEERGEGR